MRKPVPKRPGDRRSGLEQRKKQIPPTVTSGRPMHLRSDENLHVNQRLTKRRRGYSERRTGPVDQRIGLTRRIQLRRKQNLGSKKPGTNTITMEATSFGQLQDPKPQPTRMYRERIMPDSWKGEKRKVDQGKWYNENEKTPDFLIEQAKPFAAVGLTDFKDRRGSTPDRRSYVERRKQKRRATDQK